MATTTTTTIPFLSIPSFNGFNTTSTNYQAFFTSLAFLMSIIVLLIISTNKKSKNGSNLNLPPGPPGWPIVGNLFQVALSGKPFVHYVRDLRTVYGPIFTLRMGVRTLIVISNAELAHEALVKNGQAFASRPRENQTRIVFSCNKFTVNSAVYGPEWRLLRRNMVSGMLSSVRLKEFRGLRESAMDRLVGRIHSEAEANGGVVWVLKNARFAVFCILLGMCFGLDLEEDTIVKVDQVMKKVLLVLMPRIDDYLPLLSPLFSKQWKEAMDVRKQQMETIVPLIQRRRKMVDSPTEMAKAGASSFSYLDSLFDLKIEGRGNSSPSYAELVTLCSELLNGGTDTTATAIEWGIARLIENQTIQHKLHDEIVRTVGDRKVDEKDTEKMVYLQAFVKELLRRHPPTYLSLTHAAVESGAKLAGYDIPVDANLEIYLPGISEDPSLWNDPKAFNPDRFITGGEDADIMGVKDIKMIPFGTGRRVCPGLGMGMTHIALILARMVQEFEWLAHPSQSTVDLEETLEFTVVMKRTLQALVKPRK